MYAVLDVGVTLPHSHSSPTLTCLIYQQVGQVWYILLHTYMSDECVGNKCTWSSEEGSVQVHTGCATC